MVVDADYAEDEAARVFSTRKIRSRIREHEGTEIEAYRSTLEWSAERLFNLFSDGQSADSLVRARSHVVDVVLSEIWEKHFSESSSGLMLAAVGGYGRGELLPSSDIDILIVFEGDALEQNKRSLEKMMAFFWDIGLEIGSSVRSLEECVTQAEKDITVITNLIEARYLVGDTRVFAEMSQRLTPDKIWSVPEFFRAKKEEQSRRYRKFDDTGYKLEPNVKESPGGLRDIHMLGWVAKRYFGTGTLADLRDRGFLTKQECDELFAGQDFLWRVRFALHMVNGRREDRLLFDHQVKVAGLFGYVNTDPEQPNQAVEQFMQLYYRTIKSLSCLNDMLLQLFEQAILHPLEENVIRPINSRFRIRNGYIEALSDDIFRQQPSALIEVFLMMQKARGLDGISAHTVRMIMRDARLITKTVRADVRVKSLFMEMFREPRGLTRNLRRMNRYGVLGRLLPAFGRVVGLMQYDLFHTLTVDEHTLYVVRNLRRFNIPRFNDELPFCSQLMEQIQKPEVLYLAGFFHDIAKGRGGDHSAEGANDATEFCLSHGATQADAELVAWLVQNHLTMSMTAQRADITDPNVIAEFARVVENHKRLDHLFLLTVADIRATNPALWNSWRESLLMDLYKAAHRSLDRGIENPLQTDEMVAETRDAAELLLARMGINKDSTENLWGRLSDEYFLKHSPEEIAWHLPAINAVNEEDGLPLVLVDNVDGRGTTVFVYALDKDNLFALSAGVLARMGLNILDARINTTEDGYALDSYVVMEGDGRAITESHRQREIAEQMREVLSAPEISVVEVNRRLSHRQKHFNTPTSVHFSQDKQRGLTMLELVTADQPGLLSMVGRVFYNRNIRLDGAKIGTIGERAEDVFFITDKDGRPVTDEALLEDLRKVLVRMLNRTAKQG